MEIKVLGTWNSHIRAGKRNTSYLLDGKILLDCGPHTAESLLENNINISEVKLILITHLHLDHFGGLSDFLWQRAFESTEKPIYILGPENIGNYALDILTRYNTPDYFLKNIEFIDRYSNVEIGNGKHSIPDFTFKIKINDKYVFYSGDTSFSEEVIKNALNSDVFIHEATYPSGMEDIATKYGHSTVKIAMNAFRESKSKVFIPTHMSEQSMVELGNMNNKNIIVPEENNTYRF